MDHITNDIVNRADGKPNVPTKILRHSAIFNIYAPSEGLLEKVTGLGEITKLESFVSFNQVIQEGEVVYFAKNNGDPILEVVLSHADSEQLKSDIQQLKEAVSFKVTAHINNATVESL